MRSDIEGALLGTLAALSEKGFSVGVGFKGAEPHWVRSTYARSWVDNYVAKRYIQLDPTIRFGLSRTGHITWSRLERIYPGTAGFFEDARGYGLFGGNTLAIRAAGGISVLSCSGAGWGSDEVKLASAALHGLAALHAKPSADKSLELNEREQDVLRLMCGGSKDQEISEALGIKIETVRARRRRAMHATEATTVAQLVSEVIKNGLI
jgi:LuxR family transcriptional regulator